MKEETRLAKLAATFGEGSKLFALMQEEAESNDSQIQNAKLEDSREAEAVLAFINGERIFQQKECKRCEKIFMSDYACVAYCSDTCRSKALDELGISWDASKPIHERWGHPVPLVILPDTRQMLIDSLTIQETVELQSELSHSL